VSYCIFVEWNKLILIPINLIKTILNVYPVQKDIVLYKVVLIHV